MWTFFLGGCIEARIEALERDISGLEREIAATEVVVEHMKLRMERARNSVVAPRFDNDPVGFNAAAPIPPGDPKRPDVILLSIDTLRADHLGAWGYERPTSPFLDELAAQGTRFSDTWSPSPWTLPSHTTLLSGQLPSRHGTIEDDLRIRPTVPLLQESFQGAGYSTFGVVATLYVSSKYGFERGFDTFQDFGVLSKELNNLSSVQADQVFHHALASLQASEPGKPVFEFLHVYDPHYAYNPVSPWNEKFDRKPSVGDAVYKNYDEYRKHMIDDEQLAHQIAQYDEEIAFVDEQFRQLVTVWRASGRSLIVIVTADHGEEFGERGSWGHGHTLFREQLLVPWLVNGPGVKTQVVGDRVGTEDVAPTLAAFAGVPFEATDGVDRSKTLRSGTPVASSSGRLAETSRFDTVRYRLHDGSWELQLDARLAWRHLCNVAKDPWCKTNLVDGEETRANAMTAALVAAVGAPWTVREAGVIKSGEGGFLYEGGTRHKKNAAVEAGTRLSILPMDGRVMWASADGSPLKGPWRGLGGPLPGDLDPLIWTGPLVESVEKTDAETAQLVLLGYQDVDDDEGLPEGAP